MAESLTLDITAKQHDLLAQASRAVREAQERQRIVLEAIVAGHDVPAGVTYEGTQQTPPAILVRLPDAGGT
jgi:hypothetical protein